MAGGFATTVGDIHGAVAGRTCLYLKGNEGPAKPEPSSSNVEFELYLHK
jgi:hypothetical protein